MTSLKLFRENLERNFGKFQTIHGRPPKAPFVQKFVSSRILQQIYFVPKDLRSKVEQKLFAKKPKNSPINRLEGGLGFWSKKLEKVAKLLPFLFSTKSEVPSKKKSKENLKNQRGFGASVSGFPLVSLNKNFEKFWCPILRKQPAVNKVREWRNLSLVCVWFGSRIYQEIYQILVFIQWNTKPDLEKAQR